MNKVFAVVCACVLGAVVGTCGVITNIPSVMKSHLLGVQIPAENQPLAGQVYEFIVEPKVDCSKTNNPFSTHSGCVTNPGNHWTYTVLAVSNGFVQVRVDDVRGDGTRTMDVSSSYPISLFQGFLHRIK